MLVLKTTFHLRQDLPWNIVYETCVYKWLASIKDYDNNCLRYGKLLSKLPKQIDFGPEEERTYQSDGENESLQINAFTYDNIEYLGFTFVYLNNNRKWDLRTVLKRTEQSVICGVSLSCEVIKNEGIPNILKPRIIDYLLKHQAGDGGIEISDKAHILRNTDYDEALNLLTGKTRNKLPFVYLSSAGKHHALKPSTVARQLYGIAHVYAEEDAHLGTRLGIDLKTYFPRKGEIALCYPTHPMIIVNRSTDTTWQESPEVLVQDIFRKILRQSIASKSEFSWDDFQMAQVKLYKERIRERNNDDAQNKDLLNEISDLNETIEEMKIRLKKAEEERDTYFNMADESDKKHAEIKELYHSEAQARIAAENSLTRYKSKSGAGIQINYPKDPEKYDGESLAVITLALNQLADGINRKKNPRFFDVCNGIIEANPKAMESLDSIQNDIEELSKFALDQNLKSIKGQTALNGFGLRYRKGGDHGIIKFIDDDRYMITEACTPGDKARGGKNEAALLRNIFFLPNEKEDS